MQSFLNTLAATLGIVAYVTLGPKNSSKSLILQFFQGKFRVGIFEIDEIEFSDTMHLSFFKVMDWQFSAPTLRKDF